ncbi:MAG: hypothetical protein HRU19_03225 [Pseudobacteriovorax sp.]|nr:hypothetical protein [Pseudobacteriovorax sp.]
MIKRIVSNLLLLWIIIFQEQGFAEKNKSSNSLKIALPEAEKIENFDTAKIRLGSQFILLDSLYSTLVTFNNENKIVAEAASKFYWKGSELIFEIRKDLKASDGSRITAEDVKASFNRLLLLGNTNMHGNLQNFLCTKRTPRNLEESCDGIEVKNNSLHLKFPKKYPTFVSLFSALDFAIIPKKAIDKKDYSISDYSITSGPYSYSHKDKNGNLILKRSKFYKFSKAHYGQADLIEIWDDNFNKETGKLSSVEWFEKGLIDHIPTTNRWKKADLNRLSKKSGVTHHITDELSVNFVAFTKKGMKIPHKERLKIAKTFITEVSNFRRLTKYQKGIPEYLYKRRIQFFLPGGYGALSKEQVSEVESSFEKIKGSLPRKKIKIAVVESVYDFFSNRVFKNLKDQVEWVRSDRVNNYANIDVNDPDAPDLMILSQDVTFTEELGVIEFTLNWGGFPIKDKVKIDKWISKYINEDSFEERSSLLRSLHKDAILDNISMIPMYATPYRALSKNGWKMDFSTNSAVNPFWQLYLEK